MCVLGALHCYRVCTGTRAAPLQRSASPKPSTRPHSSNLGRRLKSRDGSGRNLMCYSLFSSCFSFHADSSNIQTTPCIRYMCTRPNTKPTTPAPTSQQRHCQRHAARHARERTPRLARHVSTRPGSTLYTRTPSEEAEHRHRSVMFRCSCDGLGAHGARTKSPRRCCISSTCARGVSRSHPHC